MNIFKTTSFLEPCGKFYELIFYSNSVNSIYDLMDVNDKVSDKMVIIRDVQNITNVHSIPEKLFNDNFTPVKYMIDDEAIDFIYDILSKATPQQITEVLSIITGKKYISVYNNNNEDESIYIDTTAYGQT